MRRKWFIILGLLVAFSIAAVTACAPLTVANPTQTTTASPTPLPQATVKLSSIAPVLVLGPVYIADAEGYFDEQGIDVELVFFQTAGQAVPVLAQGEIDVAHMVTSPGFNNAVARGLNMKLVTSLAASRPVDTECLVEAVVVRKALHDSGEVRGPEDLKGRRIAVPGLNGYGHFIVQQSIGLTDEEVEWVSMPLPETVAAMREGNIDAAFAGEPLVTAMQGLDVAVPLVSLHEWINNSSFLAYGPDLLEKDPELGKRFMVAFLEGARQFAEGKTPRNVEIIAEFTEMDTELVERQCWPNQDPNGAFSLENYNKAQQWFVEKGVQDTLIGEEQLADTGFLEHALRVLGKVEK